jgi:hypothetical protein
MENRADPQMVPDFDPLRFERAHPALDRALAKQLHAPSASGAFDAAVFARIAAQASTGEVTASAPTWAVAAAPTWLSWLNSIALFSAVLLILFSLRSMPQLTALLTSQRAIGSNVGHWFASSQLVAVLIVMVSLVFGLRQVRPIRALLAVLS